MGKYNCTKSIVKSWRESLKSAWHFYKVAEMKRISMRAEKLLPYYQDDMSVKWLRAREQYLQKEDFTVFAKVERKYGNARYCIGEIAGTKEVTLVYVDETDLTFRYTRQVLAMGGFASKIRLVSLKEYHDKEKSLSSNSGEVIIPAMEQESVMAFLPLVKEKGEWDSLLIPKYGKLLGIAGWQYFDMFSPNENEVVVDAGVYDGSTETEIFRWGGGGKHKENICL